VLEDREDTGLRPGQDLAGLVGGVVRIPQDVGARVDQRAQDRLVADDGRVVRGMGRVGHGLHHVGDHARAADPLEIALGLEPLHDDRGVDPLAGVVEIDQVAVERL
jgi:hypothetical protein